MIKISINVWESPDRKLPHSQIEEAARATQSPKPRIKVPEWNLLNEITPDALDNEPPIYYVIDEGGIMLEADWIEGGFYLGNNISKIELPQEVVFWLPLFSPDDY